MKRPHEQPIASDHDDARLLPHLRARARTERRELVTKQAHVLREAIAANPTAAIPTKTTAATAEPGDLRGIPVIGRGIGGASRGTQPETATVNRHGTWTA